MQTTWQQFLLEQGAQLDQHHQITFGEPRHVINSMATENILSSLDHYGAIYVSGNDARTFLQSQLSNDIQLIDDTHVQYSAYCNPKGRMFAYFLVVPFRDGYLLLLPREILSKILARLRMFVLRSAVTLEDVTELTVCIGLIGNTIQATLPAGWPALPSNDYQSIQYELTHIVRLPGPLPRFLLLAPLASATAIWHELSATFSPSGPGIWHWCDIQAGIPSVWAQTMEEFVPQMVNLDLIGGVNFKKGCYPGQEIVARMHYLGKAKRRMFHLQGATAEIPKPGTDLFLATGDGQSAGQVVIAQPAASGGVDMLAVVQLSHLQGGELHLGTTSGPALSRVPLPYPVGDEI